MYVRSRFTAYHQPLPPAFYVYVEAGLGSGVGLYLGVKGDNKGASFFSHRRASHHLVVNTPRTQVQVRSKEDRAIPDLVDNQPKVIALDRVESYLSFYCPAAQYRSTQQICAAIAHRQFANK